ncbi:MAG: acetyltransferase [Myxococcota bacterium]
MSGRRLAVFGAGGMGREAGWLVRAAGDTLVCYLDDRSVPGLDAPVRSLDQAPSTLDGVVVAIGSPTTRVRVADRVLAAGLPLATLIHPTAVVGPRVTLGPGALLMPNAVLSVDVDLGRLAQINIGASVSHDGRAGEALTLSPGARVPANVHFGDRCFVGTGASFVHGLPEAPLCVGDDAVVGAGACVIRDVPAGVTVVGVPARRR